MTRALAAPRLYLITDRKATGGRALAEVVAAALTGIAGSGLDPGDVAVQLREKDLDGRALVDLARALRATTAAAGVRLFINDRIDVALAVGADGVHLGGTSLAPAEARAIAPALAIAVSTHGIADVRAALDDPARIAFAVFGPIRDTPSKRGYGPPLGIWRADRGRAARSSFIGAGRCRRGGRPGGPRSGRARPRLHPPGHGGERPCGGRPDALQGPRDIFRQPAVSDLTLFVTLVLSGPNFHGRAGERGTSQRS